MSQLELLSLNSFTPLSTISLPQQCHLHAQACCPTMDIVALVHSTPQGTTPFKTMLSLWRLAGGPKVWGVDLAGPVVSMGWSSDGLYLAVHVDGKLVILSVHDGSTVREVIVTSSSGKGNHRATTGRDFFDADATLTWNTIEDPSQPAGSKATDETATKKKTREDDPTGSAFGIINSLPLVEPLEPSAAVSGTAGGTAFLSSTLPSNTAAAPPPVHPLLDPPLPSLLHSSLPPNPPTAPPVTLLTLNSQFPFLSGSFPLPPLPVEPLLAPPRPKQLSEEVWLFARGSSAVEELLRGAVTGLGRLENEWFGKDGASSASREWMKVYKEVGARFGVDADPSADFTRLLITGARRGEGTDTITQFLGGRLTERSLLKWETTVVSALTTIRQACYQNLLPAFERVVILLNEMRGWSLWKDKYGSLALQHTEIQRAINLSRYAAFRIRELEREAGEEARRFTEFAKWLRFEVSIATSEDASAEPSHPPTHDVLLVADYLQTSFVHSRIDAFFLSLPPSSASHPITIPSATPPLPSTHLYTTIANTIRPFATPTSVSATGGRRLSGDGAGGPSQGGKGGGDNNKKMLSPVLARRGLPRTSMERDGMEIDGPDEGGERRDYGVLEVAGELVGLLRGVFGKALGPGAPADGNEGSRRVERGELIREWVSKVETPQGALVSHSYVAFVTRNLSDDLQGPCFWLLSTSSSDPTSVKMAYFHLQLDLSSDEPDPVDILDMNFFNDEEIILVLALGQEEESKILLASIAYTALECFSVPLPEALDSEPFGTSTSPVDHVLDTLIANAESLPPSPFLPLSRVRHLPALDRMPLPLSPDDPPAVELALNGRKGRMTGSLMCWGGREVEVFDLEEDEGVEEEEEEEEEEGMEE